MNKSLTPHYQYFLNNYQDSYVLSFNLRGIKIISKLTKPINNFIDAIKFLRNMKEELLYECIEKELEKYSRTPLSEYNIIIDSRIEAWLNNNDLCDQMLYVVVYKENTLDKGREVL